MLNVSSGQSPDVRLTSCWLHFCVVVEPESFGALKNACLLCSSGFKKLCFLRHLERKQMKLVATPQPLIVPEHVKARIFLKLWKVGYGIFFSFFFFFFNGISSLNFRFKFLLAQFYMVFLISQRLLSPKHISSFSQYFSLESSLFGGANVVV